MERCIEARVATADRAECVGFMLVRGDRVLVEKRKSSKSIYPGAIAIPGGWIEAGETPEKAAIREIKEELNVVPCSVHFVCTLMFMATTLHRIHYFAIDEWSGSLENNEAESLSWLEIANVSSFDLDVDRSAINEYRRMCQSAELHRNGGER